MLASVRSRRPARIVTALTLRCCQRLVQVGDDVIDMFDAERKPDIPFSICGQTTSPRRLL